MSTASGNQGFRMRRYHKTVSLAFYSGEGKWGYGWGCVGAARVGRVVHSGSRNVTANRHYAHRRVSHSRHANT